MSGQANPSYVVIAAAIVIAGVLISASLFVAIGGAKTTTISTTATATTTSTTTVTDVTTTTISPSNVFYSPVAGGLLLSAVIQPESAVQLYPAPLRRARRLRPQPA